MVAIHGLVEGRSATPHPSYNRFVAVLDVLGMKAWLQQEKPQTIAEKLDEAFVAFESSSYGYTHTGISYGPLIGITQFSDSILAWSSDDSWASFHTICQSIKMIVAVALKKGVPLRGAIAVGETVCLPRKLSFVGEPIAEAFTWSEKIRRDKYSSVGVDLTPQLIEWLRLKLIKDPIPDYWRGSLNGVCPYVINGERVSSDMLTWFNNFLFINHFSHGMFIQINPRDLFLMRELEVPIEEQKSIEKKISQMTDFYVSSQENRFLNRDYDNAHKTIEYSFIRGEEFIELDKLRNSRQG